LKRWLDGWTKQRRGKVSKDELVLRASDLTIFWNLHANCTLWISALKKKPKSFPETIGLEEEGMEGMKNELLNEWVIGWIYEVKKGGGIQRLMELSGAEFTFSATCTPIAPNVYQHWTKSDIFSLIDWFEWGGMERTMHVWISDWMD